VVGQSADKKRAESTIKNLTPQIMRELSIKDKNTLKIVRTDTKQTIGRSLKEAVSPAQQAAIAISKKERGEKPKDEEQFEPHMMYDPESRMIKNSQKFLRIMSVWQRKVMFTNRLRRRN
jgi:predicted RNA-binding protein with RPS1 domain